MKQKVIEFNKSRRAAQTLELRAGNVVQVHRKIKEAGKERIQIFEGIIIGIKGKQSSSPTITVRKVSEGVGVELILPIYSPTIAKIEIVKRAKVRRSKLYYIRKKSAKSMRMKYKELSQFAKGEPSAAEAKEGKEEQGAPTEEPKTEEVSEKEEPQKTE